MRRDIQNRWIRDLGGIQTEDWQNISSTLREFSEMKLKDFQFKINNKILVTKSFYIRLIQYIIMHAPYVAKILKQEWG